MAFREEMMLRLGFSAEAVAKGLRTVKGKVDNFRKDVSKSFIGVAKTLAAPLTAGGLIAAFQKLRQEADHITTSAKALRISTEFFQRLQYLGEQSGIGVDKLTNAFTRLNRRIGLARAGSIEYAKAFERLGVTTEGKSTEHCHT